MICTNIKFFLFFFAIIHMPMCAMNFLSAVRIRPWITTRLLALLVLLLRQCSNHLLKRCRVHLRNHGSQVGLLWRRRRKRNGLLLRSLQQANGCSHVEICILVESDTARTLRSIKHLEGDPIGHLKLPVALHNGQHTFLHHLPDYHRQSQTRREEQRLHLQTGLTYRGLYPMYVRSISLVQDDNLNFRNLGTVARWQRSLFRRRRRSISSWRGRSSIGIVAIVGRVVTTRTVASGRWRSTERIMGFLAVSV